MAALIILAIAGSMGAAGYWVYRARPVEAGAYFVVRCLACEQKVRYPARKAGGTGHCPRCKQRLNLPTTAQPLARPTMPVRVGQRLQRAGYVFSLLRGGIGVPAANRLIIKAN